MDSLLLWDINGKPHDFYLDVWGVPTLEVHDEPLPEFNLDAIVKIVKFDNGEWVDCGYYKNNKLHRLKGPAYELRGFGSIWCQNGSLHNESGPAKIFQDSKPSEYWLEGCEYSKKQFDAIVNSELYRENPF